MDRKHDQNSLIRQTIRRMIDVSDDELTEFLRRSSTKRFRRLEIVSRPRVIPNEIYFIEKGLVRVLVADNEGSEHTIHFALEGQFSADYSGFLQKTASFYTLQALEDTETIVLPRVAIDWGYENIREGQKMGRLIAEFYFIYQDNRIKNQYACTSKQRYESITDVFPDIHNRVPQHMIASYLGITPVHLSRLKKLAL